MCLRSSTSWTWDGWWFEAAFMYSASIWPHSTYCPLVSIQRNKLIHASNILKPFHILRHSGTSNGQLRAGFKLWMGTVAKKRANCNSETWLYWSAQSRTCATFDVGKGGRMWGNHFPTSFANSWGGVKPCHICTSFIHENSDDDFFSDDNFGKNPKCSLKNSGTLKLDQTLIIFSQRDFKNIPPDGPPWSAASRKAHASRAMAVWRF